MSENATTVSVPGGHTPRGAPLSAFATVSAVIWISDAASDTCIMISALNATLPSFARRFRRWCFTSISRVLSYCSGSIVSIDSKSAAFSRYHAVERGRS